MWNVIIPGFLRKSKEVLAPGTDSDLQPNGQADGAVPLVGSIRNIHGRTNPETAQIVAKAFKDAEVLAANDRRRRDWMDFALCAGALGIGLYMVHLQMPIYYPAAVVAVVLVTRRFGFAKGAPRPRPNERQAGQEMLFLEPDTMPQRARRR